MVKSLGVYPSNPTDLATVAYVDTPLVQSVAYSASITPAVSTADKIINVGTLTGNLTINAPTGTKVDGEKLRFRFVVDTTGSRVITWNTAFVFPVEFSSSSLPTTASSKFEVEFIWYAADSVWRAVRLLTYLPPDPQFLNQQVGTNASTPTTINPGWTITAGSTVFLLLAYAGHSNVSTSTITDDAGNTWVSQGNNFVTGINSRVEIWMVANVIPFTAITHTASGTTRKSWNLCEFTHVGGTRDAVATVDTTTQLFMRSGSLTPTLGRSFAIAIVNTPDLTGTITHDADGFTELTAMPASTNVTARAAWKILTDTSAQQASWTVSSTRTSAGLIDNFPIT